MNIKQKYQNIILIILLALSVLFVYFPSLNNAFTNWDDNTYVTENKLIKDLSSDNLSAFFTEPVVGNFHPFTMISLAIDYHFYKLNPFYFHLHNLILHILNTLLVFIFIYLLSEKNTYIAFFTALLFGIHPMHVESVAWISERKDLLYTFYFILGLITYVKFYKSNIYKKYCITFLFFLLSSLSKSAAVVFPLVLLLIDFIKTKHLDKNHLLSKIPFFILSILIGWIAIKTQSTAGAVASTNVHSLSDRIYYGAYGFVIYIVKFFVPFHLNNLYLIPEKIPDLYKFCLFITVPFLMYILYKILKKDTSYFIFGILFYLITIFLVLQIITVGYAVIAERYTYIPYIGLGYLTFTYLYKLINEKSRNKKYILLTLVMCIVIYQGVLAHNRTKIWKNSETLWFNALRANPNNHTAFNNLGNFYTLNSEFDKAIECFTKAVKIMPNYYLGFQNRGAIYFEQKKYRDALNDFNKVLELDKSNKVVLDSRRICLTQLGETDIALEEYNSATNYDNETSEVYFQRGLIYYKKKEYEKAIDDFKKAISVDNKYDFASNLNIGISLNFIKKYNEAINYFNKAIEMKILDYSVYFHRGNAYFNLQKYDSALADFIKSEEMGFKNAELYRNRGYIYYYNKDYKDASKDYSKLIEISPSNAEAFYNRSVANYYLKNYKQAFEDALKAKKLGFTVDENYLTNLINRNKQNL